jgi:endonuclease III
MATTAAASRQAVQVARRLRREYPDAQCSLVHDSPLELLVATILSAQCTDERVNLVTKELFRAYRDAAAFAAAPLAELEQAVKSTGFFRNKAKNIKACCRVLVDEHGGQVPRTLDELVKLPGVGRKTGNVVLGTAYGIASGVVVDTHVTRLSRRMGLTVETDAVKIERDLMEQLPPREWVALSHRMIQHGRRVCTARNPRCDQCALGDICPRIGVVSPTKRGGLDSKAKRRHAKRPKPKPMATKPPRSAKR